MVCHRWSADSLFSLLKLAVVVCIDGVAVCAKVAAAELAHDMRVLGGFKSEWLGGDDGEWSVGELERFIY